jgi:hypothetical protein
LRRRPDGAGSRPFCLSCAVGVRWSPLTRARAQLLGPCFKTGRTECREPRDTDAGRPSPRATRHAGTRDNDLHAQLATAAQRPTTRATPSPKRRRAPRTVLARASQPTPRRPVTPRARTRGHLADGLQATGRAVVTLRRRQVHRRARTHRLNDDDRLAQFRPFASERFHVLLNSLFKVLCNFPSRYLFAIGLALGI